MAIMVLSKIQANHSHCGWPKAVIYELNKLDELSHPA